FLSFAPYQYRRAIPSHTDRYEGVRIIWQFFVEKTARDKPRINRQQNRITVWRLTSCVGHSYSSLGAGSVHYYNGLPQRFGHTIRQYPCEGVCGASSWKRSH